MGVNPMKFCESCMAEIATRDGDNLCEKCDKAAADGKRRKRAAVMRRERSAMLESFGVIKVRGALGGTYWE